MTAYLNELPAQYGEYNINQANINQMLQVPQIPYITPLSLTKVLFIAAVSYIAYKFVWTPYSIESEKRSCIDSCYKKAEKKEEGENK